MTAAEHDHDVTTASMSCKCLGLKKINYDNMTPMMSTSYESYMIMLLIYDDDTDTHTYMNTTAALFALHSHSQGAAA